MGLAGLSRGQWETRLLMDFPALDGTPRNGEPSERLREIDTRFQSLHWDQLRQIALTYLETIRRRKDG